MYYILGKSLEVMSAAGVGSKRKRSKRAPTCSHNSFRSSLNAIGIKVSVQPSNRKPLSVREVSVGLTRTLSASLVDYYSTSKLLARSIS